VKWFPSGSRVVPGTTKTSGSRVVPEHDRGASMGDLMKAAQGLRCFLCAFSEFTKSACLAGLSGSRSGSR